MPFGDSPLRAGPNHVLCLRTQYEDDRSAGQTVAGSALFREGRLGRLVWRGNCPVETSIASLTGTSNTVQNGSFAKKPAVKPVYNNNDSTNRSSVPSTDLAADRGCGNPETNGYPDHSAKDQIVGSGESGVNARRDHTQKCKEREQYPGCFQFGCRCARCAPPSIHPYTHAVPKDRNEE